jgi:hypothetical protein
LELDRENLGKHIENGGINENFKPTHKVYHLEDGKNIDLAGEGVTAKNFSASGVDSIFGSIGVQPSDLLFASGVIWVEGPLDGLYFERWLNLFQKDKPKKFRKGAHYSIQCLSPGGLSYASLSDIENEEYPEAKEIIKLTELSRKNFLIIDSDTGLTMGGSNNNQSSKLQGHKKGGIKENLIQAFGSGNFQITHGTIENYLHKLVANHPKYIKYKKDYTSFYERKKPQEAIDLGYCFMKNNKIEIAKQVFGDRELTLGYFCTEDDELYKNIQTLYNTIKSWNNRK